MMAEYLRILEEFAKENCPCEQSGKCCDFCLFLLETILKEYSGLNV